MSVFQRILNRKWAVGRMFFMVLGFLSVLGGSNPARAVADHSKFDEILKAAVKDERVDYVLIKSRFARQLGAYLETLAVTDPSELPRGDQLAYYINLYNATMIHAVIDHDLSTFKPSDNDFAVFNQKLVRTEGKLISLNELENELIRPRFGDPRVHAALVCAAVSCPPILNRAYRGDDLNAVLTSNVKRWLSDPARNEINPKTKTLCLSKIFDWYSADFGGPERVATYIQQYVDQNVGGFKVEFKEYDWSLNKTR